MLRYNATTEVIAIFVNPSSSDQDKAKNIHKLLDKIYDSYDKEKNSLNRQISDMQKILKD